MLLIRHGEAATAADDSRRPLTARGREDVRRAGEALLRRGLRPGVLVHSGLVRAEESAAILGSLLQPARGRVELAGALAPTAPADWLAAALEGGDPVVGDPASPPLLVGHLPHLGRLTSLLLTGDPDGLLLDLAPAAWAWLRRGSVGWSLVAVVPPDGVGE